MLGAWALCFRTSAGVTDKDQKCILCGVQAVFLTSPVPECCDFCSHPQLDTSGRLRENACAQSKAHERAWGCTESMAFPSVLRKDVLWRPHPLHRKQISFHLSLLPTTPSAGRQPGPDQWPIISQPHCEQTPSLSTLSLTRISIRVMIKPPLLTNKLNGMEGVSE